MRIITISLILTILPIFMFAINSNAGEYGFQFLQIPISPVASALAGNGIYANNYPGAFVLNPAANLMDEGFSLSLNHSVWLVDTNLTQIIYSRGNRNKHFGLSARVLDYGQIDTRDDTGAIIGNYHPLDANLMTNIAYRVLPDHMIGVNVGLLYEKIESASSYGITSDLGYVFLPPITNSVFFASMRNLGVTSEMEKEAVKLPLTCEVGIGYSIPSDVFTLSQQVAVNKAADSEARYNVSAELALWKTLALRLGYKFNYSDENLTAGLGINWREIGINYGWTSFSDRLNDTHTFGITYNF
jgi:hypothetical protein